MLEQGIPIEAIVTELVLSGEVGADLPPGAAGRWRGADGVPLTDESVRQLSRAGRLRTPSTSSPRMRELVDDIASGRFADEWDDARESRAGYPQYRGSAGQGHGTGDLAFEADLRSKLGEGAAATLSYSTPPAPPWLPSRSLSDDRSIQIRGLADGGPDPRLGVPRSGDVGTTRVTALLGVEIPHRPGPPWDGSPARRWPPPVSNAGAMGHQSRPRRSRTDVIRDEIAKDEGPHRQALRVNIAQAFVADPDRHRGNS